MARASALRYAAPLLLALLSASSSAESREKLKDVSTIDGSLSYKPTESDSLATSLKATEKAAGGGDNDLQKELLMNQRFVDREAAYLNENFDCADWGVMAYTSRQKMNARHDDIEDDPTQSYMKFSHGGGVSLQLYARGGYPMMESACLNFTDLYKTEGVASGGDAIFDVTPRTYASMMVSFWRMKATAMTGSDEKAKLAIEVAAQHCATIKKLPVDDVSGWPECIGDLIIKPEQAKEAPEIPGLSYIAVMTDELAPTVATNVPEGFGLVNMTLTLTSGGLTKDLTFYGLRM